jgi:hypothetical protein
MSMNTLLKGAAIAALASTVLAGSANAAVIITNVAGQVLNPGYALVVDFDNAPAAGYSTSGNLNIRLASSNTAAQPPGDSTAFLALQPGQALTITSTQGFTAFSFYMGSPDTFNFVRVWDGGVDVTRNGSALMGLPVISANGNQGVGRTVTWDLGGAVAHKITFSSTGVAFELDNIATLASAVPEPTTWALMIGGFGLAGAALRRRHQVIA